MSAEHVDPVCGMSVDPASAPASTVHDGKTYYFCCPSCLQRFQADPGRYLHRSAAPPLPEPAAPGTTYTCPTHPEVVSDHPGSCPKCGGSGYKGRIGTHELLVMNAPLREICGRHGVTAAEINKVALDKADMISLFDDEMSKVKEGVTSIEEALRTVRVEKD